MHITAALSTDLALLTQALDRPETDIAETLHQLATDVRVAVPSYLGLSLSSLGDPSFTFTALEEQVTPEKVRSSLQMTLPHSGPHHAPAGSALVLYAARAGAFVDLAADLSWLTGVELSDYALNQHLSPIALGSGAPTVNATSVINQAIGVLIGCGHLPDEAHEKLTTQAVDANTDRYGAAADILATATTDTNATMGTRE